MSSPSLYHSTDQKPSQPNRQISSNEFDFESIMLYTSRIHSRQGADFNELNDLPLVKWKVTGNDAPSQDTKATHENAEFIWENQTPPKKDVEGLKKMYPYKY